MKLTDPSRPSAGRWIGGLVIAGLIWRLGRYLLCFPLWGDEAFVACDVLERDFGALFSNPPAYFQVVPLLHRWLLRAAYECLGPSEYALRLPSLLAGCTALLLFARLASKTLPATAATLASGVFAVSYPLVRHACEVKPYAMDALAGVLMLGAALKWTERPSDWRWPIAFTVLAAGLVWLSFPAILVAGGLLLGLVFNLRGRQRVWCLGSAVVVLTSFYMNVELYARVQMERSAGSWLEHYWAEGFPPLSSPLGALYWLARAHLSEMVGYPLGGVRFGSSLNGLLAILGAVGLFRSRRAGLAAMLLAPFAAGIAAAVLHRYPYGVAARLAQHLTPFICLLIGIGTAILVDGCRLRGWGEIALKTCVAGLLLFAALGLTRDLLKPYKLPEDVEVRTFIQHLSPELHSSGVVVILNPLEAADEPDTPPPFWPPARYYLMAGRVQLDYGEIGPLPPNTRWVLTCQGTAQPPHWEEVAARALTAGLRIVETRESGYLPVARKTLTAYRCEPAAPL